jgi:SAM-dependent methyltransferase
MDEATIKSAVTQHYARVVQESSAGCCAPSASDCCGTSLVDYGDLDAQLPVGANLGLGCGLPVMNADLHAGEVVLDLGSGAGVDVFLAAQSVGPTGRVIGVDMTPDMVQKARANAARGGYENVEFRLGEIEHLPLEKESVDVILSNCVINLVSDKRRVFAEMFRVLKPGGRFSVSDMVTTGEVPAALRQDPEAWSCCLGGALDQEVYLDLLGKAGFVEVKISNSMEYNAYRTEAYRILSVTVEGRKP